MAKGVGPTGSHANHHLYGRTKKKMGDDKKLRRQVKRGSVSKKSHIDKHDQKARKVLDDRTVKLQLAAPANKELKDKVESNLRKDIKIEECTENDVRQNIFNLQKLKKLIKESEAFNSKQSDTLDAVDHKVKAWEKALRARQVSNVGEISPSTASPASSYASLSSSRTAPLSPASSFPSLSRRSISSLDVNDYLALQQSPKGKGQGFSFSTGKTFLPKTSNPISPDLALTSAHSGSDSETSLISTGASSNAHFAPSKTSKANEAKPITKIKVSMLERNGPKKFEFLLSQNQKLAMEYKDLLLDGLVPKSLKNVDISKVEDAIEKVKDIPDTADKPTKAFLDKVLLFKSEFDLEQDVDKDVATYQESLKDAVSQGSKLRVMIHTDQLLRKSAKLISRREEFSDPSLKLLVERKKVLFRARNEQGETKEALEDAFQGALDTYLKDKIGVEKGHRFYPIIKDKFDKLTPVYEVNRAVYIEAGQAQKVAGGLGITGDKLAQIKEIYDTKSHTLCRKAKKATSDQSKAMEDFIGVYSNLKTSAKKRDFINAIKTLTDRTPEELIAGYFRTSHSTFNSLKGELIDIKDVDIPNSYLKTGPFTKTSLNDKGMALLKLLKLLKGQGKNSALNDIVNAMFDLSQASKSQPNAPSQNAKPQPKFNIESIIERLKDSSLQSDVKESCLTMNSFMNALLAKHSEGTDVLDEFNAKISDELEGKTPKDIILDFFQNDSGLKIPKFYLQNGILNENGEKLLEKFEEIQSKNLISSGKTYPIIKALKSKKKISLMDIELPKTRYPLKLKRSKGVVKRTLADQISILKHVYASKKEATFLQKKDSILVTTSQECYALNSILYALENKEDLPGIEQLLREETKQSPENLIVGFFKKNNKNGSGKIGGGNDFHIPDFYLKKKGIIFKKTEHLNPQGKELLAALERIKDSKNTDKFDKLIEKLKGLQSGVDAVAAPVSPEYLGYFPGAYSGLDGGNGDKKNEAFGQVAKYLVDEVYRHDGPSLMRRDGKAGHKAHHAMNLLLDAWAKGKLDEGRSLNYDDGHKISLPEMVVAFFKKKTHPGNNLSVIQSIRKSIFGVTGGTSMVSRWLNPQVNRSTLAQQNTYHISNFYLTPLEGQKSSTLNEKGHKLLELLKKVHGSMKEDAPQKAEIGEIIDVLKPKKGGDGKERPKVRGYIPIT